MNEMRKKWFIMLAVMLLAGGTLYGCGNKKDDTDTTGISSETDTTVGEELSTSAEGSSGNFSSESGTDSEDTNTSAENNETTNQETTESDKTEPPVSQSTVPESTVDAAEPTIPENTKESTAAGTTEPSTESTAGPTTESASEGNTEPSEDGEDDEEGEPVAANFYGTWYGAENSLDGNYYTGYLKLELSEKTWHTVDQEAGNPGFDADIVKATSDKLILNPTMMDSAPANWKLEEGKEAEITYKNPNKYELWLTYDGITCIFYRGMTSSELAGAAGDFIDPYVGPYWKSAEGGNLGISFGYYDLKFVDMSQNGKVLLSGSMIIDAKNGKAEVIPDITQGVAAISEWPELADGTHFTMKLEHYGEEEIRVTCFGRTVSFAPAELN